MSAKNNHQDEQPLITIGITCFNAEETIERALESALKQDWPHFEIVIVDDCSTDKSVEHIKRLTERDSRVKLFQQPVNRGYPAALNKIIENANGEFIAIFDDDDVSTPNRLHKEYERITTYEEKHNTEMVFCYTNRTVLYKDNVAPSYQLQAIGRKAPEPYGPIVADFLLWYPHGKSGYIWGLFGSCTLMFRKKTIEKAGIFDESFRRSAEWDMAVRASFLGMHFIAVDELLVTQLKTITADKSGKIPLQYGLKLCHKHKDYLSKKGVYFSARIIARARFYGGQGKKWRQLFYLVLTILSAPQIYVPLFIERKCRKKK